VAELVGALDQGTTSTRFIVFNHDGDEVARHQLEHAQVMPQPGWVEHDPVEIWERACSVIGTAMARADIVASDLVAVGIANQRETTVVWDRRSGRPLYNAIVWQDTRTAPLVAQLGQHDIDLVRQRTGLTPSTYFSGPKLSWILDHVEGVRAAAERGDALFGTIDSWLLWNLTDGLHATDVTNASRTMLMDLEALDWDDELLELFRIPRAMLPEVRPCTGAPVATSAAGGPFGGPVRVAAVLGDQQAAMVGQARFEPGEAKCTYGTGNFLLMNTGTQRVRSEHGLLTTVCYQFEGQAARFALEGAVAVTGAAVQWLRDQLGVVSSAAESEALAREVEDSEGLYFVPAFSGLFAPYWRADARGVIVGLCRSHTAAHLARATLEAIAYQTRDVIDVMADDSGRPIDELRVDGGVTANHLCMQLQADVLGVPVLRPVVTETTALGAAYAAGLAVGFFGGTDELRSNWREGRRWAPEWSRERRSAGCAGWKKAVERTLGWDS
jgi:glycerol kinase